MSHGTRQRYPGAQPFEDDALSSEVFFGREEASSAVFDRVVSSRLLVLYAKSGLGKTSLLRAGVAPLLRKEGYLPLTVRLNDTTRDLATCVYQAVAAEGQRQGAEFVAGSEDSLWSFFKTAELWRNDLLQTPVLILDQFEELFTLQSEARRGAFLTELGYLVRGASPPNVSGLSASAPTLRIVLSLREDYLGLLEEAADHIPQILDHRYRLAPLSLSAARDAMVKPAAIDDPALATRPFVYEPAAIETTLNYLSARRATTAQAGRYVEPFQLQLICQRVERGVAARQGREPQVSISMQDLGGEEGLAGTLKSFYVDTLRALPTRRLRNDVQRLCEQFLISAEGRRLSLEESEIEQQCKLSPSELKALVASRLLRSESRTDSVYYELSHDALVEPVLAARRTGGLVAAWVQIATGATVFLLSALFVVGTPFWVLAEDEADQWLPLLMIMTLFGMSMAMGGRLWRAGLWAKRRYQRRDKPELNGWSERLLRTCAILLLGLDVLFAVLMLGTIWSLSRGQAPPAWLQKLPGPSLDLSAALVGLTLFAWLFLEVVRWCGRRMGRWPPAPGAPGTGAGGFNVRGLAKVATAAVAACVLVTSFVIELRCVRSGVTEVPLGLPKNLFTETTCDSSTVPTEWVTEIAIELLIIGSLLAFGARALFRMLPARSTASLP